MLEVISKKIENFIDVTGRMVSWLTLAMVLVTFVVLVLRYGFGIGSIALQESIAYMHASVFLIAAAWTLQQDAHVRVDIVYCRCSKKTRALVDLFGSLFLLLPLMFFIVWISFDYVQESWRVHEGSPEAGGLPGVFLLKTLIPVMAILLVLQGTANILKSLITLRDRN
jgi:TRAP-type mannitol/chloroaromatic compound transport system permease small subunit